MDFSLDFSLDVEPAGRSLTNRPKKQRIVAHFGKDFS